MPQLIVSLEDDYPQVIDIGGPRFTIGRHSGNNLQLPFSFISSFHAEMMRDPSGNYRLSDLDSHNGTFINGNPVNATTIKDGDQVSFGPIKARFIATAPGTAAVPEARPDYIADSPATSAALAAAPMAISEVRLEAKLREKVAAEFEKENVAAGEILRSTKAEYERLRKEAEIQKSDMTMREHIVRDLEKSRVREEERLATVRVQAEQIEAARRELTQIEAKIVESRDAGEKADQALKNLLEYESRAVQLESDVTAKQHEADEIEAELAGRRRQLADSAEELEVLRREADTIRTSDIVEAQAEVERLRQQSTDLEKGMALRQEQAEKLDAARKDTEKRASDFAARANELSAEVAKREKQLTDLDATVTQKEQETAAAEEKLTKLHSESEEKLTKLRSETEDIENTRLPELLQHVERLNKESDEKQRELDGKLERFREVDEQREEAERITAEAKAQHADTIKELEEYRADRERLIKELQEARSTSEVLKKEVEKHGAENEGLLEKRRLLEEEVVNAGQLRDELQAKIKESRMAASQCEAEVKRLEETQVRQKEIETEYRTCKENVAATTKDLEKNRRDLTEVETALDEARKKAEEMTTVTLVKLREESDGLETAKSEKRKEIDKLKTELDKESADRGKAIDKLKSEIEELTQSRENGKQALAEKAAELKHIDSECEKRTGEVEALSKENNALQKEQGNLKKELETAQSQLEDARKQAEDLKKVGKKVAAELRSLEEHKAANARIENVIENRKSDLQELDGSITERRKALRQVEKTLGSIERTARKDKRRLMIPLAAKVMGKSRLDDDHEEIADEKPPADEKSPAEKKPPADEKPPAVEEPPAKEEPVVDEPVVDEAAAREAEKLARENEELARRLAEKETALATLEKELEDLATSASLVQVESEVFDDGAPVAQVENLDAREEPPAGVELLNTGDSEDLPKPGDESKPADKPESKDKPKAKAPERETEKPKSKAKAGAKGNGKSDSKPSRASKFLRGDVAAAVIAGGRRIGAAATRGRKSSSSRSESASLRIVHPRSREETRFFTDGPGVIEDGHQPPIGLFALAACTGGSIHRSIDTLPDDDNSTLLLLGGSLEKDGELIRAAASEARHRPLLICWREGRLEKLATDLEGGSAYQQFNEMLETVDGIVSTDPRTTELLEELEVAIPALEIPLPYPIDVPKWDFSIPLAERKDAIFVAADGYDPEIEHHRTRLELVNLIAAKHRLRVTVYHHLPDLLTNLNVPEDLLDEPNKTLSYGDYLSEMARHRFTVGFGKNLAGGDVMGDALLTGTAYIGGRSGIEPILFTGSSLVDDDLEDLEEKISALILDPDAYTKSLEASKKRALSKVSFGAVRTSLDEFVASLSEDEAAVPV